MTDQKHTRLEWDTPMYRLAVSQGGSPWRAIAEHLAIATVVVVITHLVGLWTARLFA